MNARDLMMNIADVVSVESDGRILFTIALLIAIVGVAITLHSANNPRPPG